MVGSLFGQLQQLLGRAFLVSAFIPVVVAAAFGVALFEGIDVFEEVVDAWARDSGQAIFQVALVLVGAYLVAYLLYGLRGAVSRLFQGAVPEPLARRLRRRQAAALDRIRQELAKALAELDVAYWPLEYHFAPSGTPRGLTRDDAERWLTDATKALEKLKVALDPARRWEADQPVPDERLREVLEKAMVLQSSAEFLGADPKVTALVEGVKATWDEHPRLEPVLARIRERALREVTEAAAELNASFPDSEQWLKPTRFGNAHAALDYSILRRYRIRLGTLWPRLLHVLPADVRSRVDDSTSFVDFTLMMSFLSAAGFVAAGVAVAAGPSRPVTLTVSLLLAPLTAWALFYRLAVAAVRALAEHVQAAVDLFRLDLLDALRITSAGRWGDELAIWSELETFIARGDLREDMLFRSRN